MGRLLISAGWNNKINQPILKYYNLETEQIEVDTDSYYKNHWLCDEKNDSPKYLLDAVNNKMITLYEYKGNFPNKEANNYEHKIRKHHNYLLSEQYICGAVYERKKKLLDVNLNNDQQSALDRAAAAAPNQLYKNYLKEYTNILSQPVPNIKRLAIDIEVHAPDGVFPSVKNPVHPITCVGLAASNGYRRTLTLNNESLHKQNPKVNYDFISYFTSERKLLQTLFAYFEDYPIIVTFNGDDFDLAYLYMRAKQLEIQNIPIVCNEEDFNRPVDHRDAVLIENGIHLDLFRIFKNRSLHNYAFNARYKQFGLDPISMAILGEGKIHHAIPLNQLTQEDLSGYCLNDAELTLKLTTYSNNLLIKLLILISRITKTSIEDIGRFGISNWIKQMLYFEHRKQHTLIPNREMLAVKGTTASTHAVIKDKKYKGAFVMEPVPGAHFNVICLDFASLYPSIIKSNNISYETINCGHEICRDNLIPETPHYTCKQKIGMLPLLVGVFRDLRVEYFKKLSKSDSLSKEDLEVYDAVTQAIKVILNGTYGVLGAEAFQLYCLPVAESVTAQGRHIITKTKEFVESLGLQVVYGDTDSLYTVNPTKEQQIKIIKYPREHYGIDLEVDKEYRYVMFSSLKKNYVGVKKDGKLDIKGLVGKKSNIPKFIRTSFSKVCEVLQSVNSPQELEVAKDKVSDVIKNSYIRLDKLDYPLEDFTFNHMIQKNPHKYGIKKLVSKTTSLFDNNKVMENYRETNVPPHAKVARQMEKQGIKIEDKMFIPFVKTLGGQVEWIKEAKLEKIDRPKYKETMKKVFEPLLQVLNMDFDKITEIRKVKTLDEIFFNM